MTSDGEALRLTLPEISGIATYPAGATFGPRRMRDFEFVWLLQGDAQYRSGSILVEAPADSIVLCRPGTTDFFRWDETRRTRHAFFHFKIERTPESWLSQNQWPLVRTAQDADILRPLFRYLLAWLGRGEDDSCRRALELLLSAFVTGHSSTGEAALEVLPEAIERALHFLNAQLENDPATPIALRDLARAAFVSPEHLCRVFKHTTGRTPLETVRLVRLDKASTLLARSNYSIQEIAALCGFASPFHFSRKFKAAYGASPREVRRAIRDGSTPPTPLLLHTRHN